VQNLALNSKFNFGLNATAMPDLWRVASVGNVVTSTKTAFALGNTDVNYSPLYYMSHAFTASAGVADYAYFAHKIEDIRTIANNLAASPGYAAASVSFWAKASSAMKVAIELVQNFGTGGSPSAETAQVTPRTLDLTTAWTLYTTNIILNPILGKTLGTNNDSLIDLKFWLSAGANYVALGGLAPQSGTIDIALPQVVPGTVSTPYHQRFFGQELELVSRYIQRIGGAANTEICMAMGQSATTYKGVIQLPVPMRANPTISFAGAAADYGIIKATSGTVTNNVPTGVAVSKQAATLAFTQASGGVAGNAAILQTQTANGIITFNAAL
jgi:hypothetical protein